MAPEASEIEVQGATIPRLGLGTWELRGTGAVEGVRDAIELGYRHIDTGRAYGNEREVGRAIADSGIDRRELFVTTKLWFDRLSARGAREQLEGSLRDLRLEHVDLLLIHWPNPDVPVGETLGEMARLREEGRAVSLGVSNFPTAELREALAATQAPLLVEQVEYHPFLDQGPLLDLLREHGMALTAYSPLAGGAVAADPTLREIGEAHGKSATQVGLRWLIEQPDVAAIPRSSSHERRAANLAVFDFELSAEERARIDALPKGRRTIDPGFAPSWDAG